RSARLLKARSVHFWRWQHTHCRIAPGICKSCSHLTRVRCTGYVSDAQTLITGYVIDERRVRGYIQMIIDRTAYAIPVRGKAVPSHIGCALYVRNRRCAGQRLYVFHAGITACSRPAGAILDFKELEWA